MSQAPTPSRESLAGRPRTPGRRPTSRSPSATASRLERIVRFDLNTSPAPPDLALRLLRAGDFGRAISEYPPADYRDLVQAAAARYGVGERELLVGAGADEILDLLAKAFLPPGAAAVIPTPNLCHVPRADRAAPGPGRPRPARFGRRWLCPRRRRDPRGRP